jgi:hypothetical protein
MARCTYCNEIIERKSPDPGLVELVANVVADQAPWSAVSGNSSGTDCSESPNGHVPMTAAQYAIVLTTSERSHD